jgi:hypothetical protein
MFGGNIEEWLIIFLFCISNPNLLSSENMVGNLQVRHVLRYTTFQREITLQSPSPIPWTVHNTSRAENCSWCLCVCMVVHLPSQLGSAWFHWWLLSQRRGSSSLRVYPGSQLNVTVDLMPKLLPCRWPFTGMPGSRQESDSRVTPRGMEMHYGRSFCSIERKKMSLYQIISYYCM